MSIWEDAMGEMANRNAYKYEIYAPYYISSWAMHVFNLENQKRGIYYESGNLPNMRTHILFVAPPGWMKTFYMGTMGGNKHAIFRRGGVQVGMEQYMTEAGFVGTMQQLNGVNIATEGAAKTYADGVMIIDEFSAITKALQMQHSNQLDNQLLSALDHGHVVKRLGGGKIEFDTRMTMWAGIQPARLDLTSGLGRRLTYMVFIPTKADNEYLMNTMHENRNQPPNRTNIERIWERQRKFKDEMKKVESVTFDDSILAMYKKLGLFSFEGSYFDRIALGYHLAVYGPEKNITVTMNDKILRKMVEQEKTWRTQITEGIEHVQLRRIIELAAITTGGKVHRNVICMDAAMYGWTAEQVLEMLKDMKSNSMITIIRGMVELI